MDNKTWAERIVAAEKRGFFTQDDIFLVAETYDAVLDLGNQFEFAVRGNNPQDARDVLAKIQAWWGAA